jgi:hypothetical protein
VSPDHGLDQALVQLGILEGATWFELPRGRRAVGLHTRVFVYLSRSPHLPAARPRIEALLAHPNAAAAIYAALLLRRIDREAGDRALADLAASGAEVVRHHPALLRPNRTRRVPIAEVIAEVMGSSTLGA